MLYQNFKVHSTSIRNLKAQLIFGGSFQRDWRKFAAYFWLIIRGSYSSIQAMIVSAFSNTFFQHFGETPCHKFRGRYSKIRVHSLAAFWCGFQGLYESKEGATVDHFLWKYEGHCQDIFPVCLVDSFRHLFPPERAQPSEAIFEPILASALSDL